MSKGKVIVVVVVAVFMHVAVTHGWTSSRATVTGRVLLVGESNIGRAIYYSPDTSRTIYLVERKGIVRHVQTDDIGRYSIRVPAGTYIMSAAGKCSAARVSVVARQRVEAGLLCTP